MLPVAACLVDVYQTIVSCDWSAHRSVLPALAGVEPRRWNDKFIELAPLVSDGRMSMAQAYSEVLRSAAVEFDEDLIEALVARDRELLVEGASLYDDVVPFLELLRRRGIPAAFVSNCAENTRHLLDDLGVLDLVDAVVLSCEVGYLKPAPQIYRIALDQLDAAPEQTVFVDDQPDYCEGAARLGVRAVHIVRDRGDFSGSGVRSLRDVEAMLSPEAGP